MIDTTRFNITDETDVPHGRRYAGTFHYRDLRGIGCTGRAYLYLPAGADEPMPLMYAGGYELFDEERRAEFLARGWAIATPATPAPGETWPAENPLPRSVNLDVAFLHIA